MINRAAFTLIVGISLLAAESASGSPATDRKAVLGTVQLLLDGWREADAAKVERALHPQFREVTLHLSDGEWKLSVVERGAMRSRSARSLSRTDSTWLSTASARA